jgi:adenylate kinase family enzyme
MNIAENILKHSLQNVYFLTGTACGGKTTAAGALSEKYGFIHFNDNWHEDSFQVWVSLIDERYQKRASKRSAVTDWEAYFGQSLEEFLAAGDYNGYGEYLEFAIIELIKLSQNNKVVADVSFPVELLVQISEYNRIAYMLAAPELVTCANYGKREDHREFLECLLSLKEPEKKIAVQDELFRINVEKAYEDARKHNLFSIVRNEESTVEGSLKMLEAHFGLS